MWASPLLLTAQAAPCDAAEMNASVAPDSTAKALKAVTITVAVVALVIGGRCVYQERRAPAIAAERKAQQEREDRAAVTETIGAYTPDDLISAYAANEVRADETFKNNWVIVVPAA